MDRAALKEGNEGRVAFSQHGLYITTGFVRAVPCASKVFWFTLTPTTLPPPSLTDPWEGSFLVQEKERLQEKSLRQWGCTARRLHPWSRTVTGGVAAVATGLGQWSQVVVNRTPLANSNPNSQINSVP